MVPKWRKVRADKNMEGEKGRKIYPKVKNGCLESMEANILYMMSE